MRGLLLFFIAFCGLSAHGADRYFINPGGNVTWDGSSSAYWSTTSGGSGGASVPGLGDNVFFDANSGTYIVTGSYGNAYCNNIDFTGYTGTFTGAVELFGNATFASGMSVGSSLFVVMYGASKTLTTNGVTGLGLFIYSTASVTLQDNLVGSGSMNVYGTFNSNGYSVEVADVYSEGTLTLGSSTWTLTSSGAPWFVTSGTVNAGTSTIKMNNSGSNEVTFYGGGKTYWNVRFERGAATAQNSIAGNNTFFVLADVGTAAHNFSTSGTQTITGTLGIAGSSCSVRPTITGGGTFSKASSSNQLNYVRIENTTFTGGATWTAEYSKDLGGNSGITFNGLHACSSNSGHFFKP